MSRIALVLLVCVVAVPVGTALADAIADGTFAGTGKQDSKAHYSFDVASGTACVNSTAPCVNAFKVVKLKFTCNDGFEYRGTVLLDFSIPITVSSSSGLDVFQGFGGDDEAKPTVIASVAGEFKNGTQAHGLYKAKEFLNHQHQFKPNGPVVCKSGTVAWTATRQT